MGWSGLNRTGPTTLSSPQLRTVRVGEQVRITAFCFSLFLSVLCEMHNVMLISACVFLNFKRYFF